VLWLPELGYIVPVESRVLNFVPLVQTAEPRLWERYVQHWTRESVRMHTYAKESPCALQYFDANRRHFSMFFAVFFAQVPIPLGSNASGVALVSSSGAGGGGGAGVDGASPAEKKPGRLLLSYIHTDN